jgi:hypothetical protein
MFCKQKAVRSFTADAFLPPNTTAKLQHVDQGVTKNLKHHYCKRTIQKMFNRIDNGKIFNITLTDCVMKEDKAWYKIASETISECFKKADANMKGFEKIGKKLTIFHDDPLVLK